MNVHKFHPNVHRCYVLLKEDDLNARSEPVAQNIFNWTRRKLLNVPKRLCVPLPRQKQSSAPLDFVLSEDRSNRLAHEANERFLKSGIQIKDVYGVLDE